MSQNIRYFFPVGCKGIDVLIDNSSRLRSLLTPDPYAHIRLPVTLKPHIVQADEVPMPSNGYVLPGPPHIYHPNQLQTAATKPPVLYLPPTEPTTAPSNVYLPPVKPENPPNVYLPPPEIVTEIIPPEVPEETLPPEFPEEIIPEVNYPDATCGGSTCCEEAGLGSFIIPIPLKSSGCCAKYAKLILPVKGFDEDSIKKLTTAVTTEIDGTKLLQDIFTSLLK